MKALLGIIILALGGNLSAATTYHDATQVTAAGIQSGWGIAHSATNLYVSDWDADVIREYDKQGQQVAVIGASGNGDGEFYGPKGLAVDTDGTLYVADAGNERVQVLSAAGVYQNEWTDPTDPTTSSFSPEDIAIGQDGRVYVSDAANHRIVIFSKSGVFLGTWGHLGFSGQYGMAWPEGICIDNDGNVLVADSGNGRVLCYTNNGVYIRQIGSRGLGQGQFDSPMDVTVHADGHILVSDNGGQRVQAFDSNGVFEFWWGQNAGGVYFEDIYGLDNGPDGHVLVADGLTGKLYSMSWDSVAASTSWAGDLSVARVSVKASLAAGNEFAVGPVPARPGEALCLYLDSSPATAEWKVYSIDGRQVAELHFDGQSAQCWNGSGSLAKGVYLIQLHLAWGDGRHQDRVQKIVLR
jgi:DNA-binding beta-propeller fold protein YncE